MPHIVWMKATYEELEEEADLLHAELLALRGAVQKLVDAMLAADSLDTSYDVTEALVALQQVLKQYEEEEEKC